MRNPQMSEQLEHDDYLILFGIPILKQLQDKKPCYRITLTAWFAADTTLSANIPKEYRIPQNLKYEVFTKTMYLLHKQNLIKALAGRQATEQITDAGLKYLEEADLHYKNWCEKRQQKIEKEKQELEKEKLRREKASKKSGKKGEKKTYNLLSSYDFGRKVKLRRNIVYLSRKKEIQSEIDIVLLHPKGIFIIETKERFGLITGNKADEYWYYTPFNAKKECNEKDKTHFRNPFRQTKRQAWILSKRLKVPESEIHVIIVFSDQAELHLESARDNNKIVVKRANLITHILNVLNRSQINRTDEEIEDLYQKIL